jgi:hypothetical protein
MNTAKMREKARYYESILDWSSAAECWEEAVRLYPHPYPRLGELEEKDIKRMQQRAINCRSSAKSEAEVSHG